MNDSNGSNQMKTVVDSKDVIKVTDNKRKYWYYVISATVGAPGFSESEEYESIHFNSFEDCFRDYAAFQPHTEFYELRRIGSESFIYVNDDEKHVTFAQDGLLFYDNAETELRTTEHEFDNIIETFTSKKR